MEAREVLPIDCWQSIFNHLDDDGLEAVSLVCKDFLTISNSCKDILRVVHPGVGILSKQLKRFKHLKMINLTQFTGDDLDEAILEIARSDISLEVFYISREVEVKIKSLIELGSNPKMKNLKALAARFSSRIFHNNDLEVMTNSFPNLEELKIDYYFEPDNDTSSPQFSIGFGIEFLASKLRVLKEIHICGIHYVSDRSLIALSMNCSFLKAVTIISRGDHGDITQNGIGLLLRNTPNLERLCVASINMNSTESTITIENSISHAKTLTSLNFFDMDISDNLLIAIAKAKLRLKKLWLKFCKKFTVMGLLRVLSSYQLTELCIRNANIHDVDMELLLNTDVGNVTLMEIWDCQVTNSTFFLILNKCPSLVEFRMNEIELDGHVNNISSFKHHRIRNLDLKNCIISDEFAKEFGLIFLKLGVLDLSNCYQITVEVIEAILKSCKLIKELILSRYSKTKMIEAENSELPEVNLEDLTLSDSLIDDEGLLAIAKRCHWLVYLDLDYCKRITAEGIEQIIKNSTTLECLYLHDCIYINYGDLLEWMLSTGNLAYPKKIYIGKSNFTDQQRDQFLHHGCLLI